MTKEQYLEQAKKIKEAIAIESGMKVWEKMREAILLQTIEEPISAPCPTYDNIVHAIRQADIIGYVPNPSIKINYRMHDDDRIRIAEDLENFIKNKNANKHENI